MKAVPDVSFWISPIFLAVIRVKALPMTPNTATEIVTAWIKVVKGDNLSWLSPFLNRRKNHIHKELESLESPPPHSSISSSSTPPRQQ